MKKFIIKTLGLYIIFLVLGLSYGEGLADPENKIGLVDLNTLFRQYLKTQKAQTEFDLKVKNFQEEFDKYNAEVVQLESELKTQEFMLTPEKKKEKERIILQKRQSLEKFHQEGIARLQQENKRMVNEILKEIRETIARYAQEKGYDFILNRRIVFEPRPQETSEWDIVLYSAEKFDLTNIILDILNSAEKKK